MLRHVQPVLVPCAVAVVFFALGDRTGPWLDRPGREMPAEARTRHASKPMGAAGLRLTSLPLAAARTAEGQGLAPVLRLSSAPGPTAPVPVPHGLAALSVPVLRPGAELALPDLGPALPESEATPVNLEPSPVEPEPASLSAEPPAAVWPTPAPQNPEAEAQPSVHSGTDPDSHVDYYEVNNLPEAEGQAVEAPAAGRDVNMIDDPGLPPKDPAPDDSAGQDAADKAVPDKAPADNDSSMTSDN